MTGEMSSSRLLVWWNVGAAISVLFPLFIFIFSRVRNAPSNVYAYQEDCSGNQSCYQGGSRNNKKQQGRNDDYSAPWWWFFPSNGDPEEEGKGAILFAYLYTLIVFAGLTLYGNHVIRRATEFGGLQSGLIIFGNFALVLMILLGALGVRVDGENVDKFGWWGQISVSLFLTCLFWFIHCTIFTHVLRGRRGSETPYAVRPSEETAVRGGNYFAAPMSV